MFTLSLGGAEKIGFSAFLPLHLDTFFVLLLDSYGCKSYCLLHSYVCIL